MYDLPPTAKACNCAACNRLLLGESEWRWAAAVNDAGRGHLIPPVVFIRVAGRPYCQDCDPGRLLRIPSDEESNRRPAHRSLTEDDSPWRDNNVRAWEDACAGEIR